MSPLQLPSDAVKVKRTSSHPEPAQSEIYIVFERVKTNEATKAFKNNDSAHQWLMHQTTDNRNPFKKYDINRAELFRSFKMCHFQQTVGNIYFLNNKQMPTI